MGVVTFYVQVESLKGGYSHLSLGRRQYTSIRQEQKRKSNLQTPLGEKFGSRQRGGEYMQRMLDLETRKKSGICEFES